MRPHLYLPLALAVSALALLAACGGGDSGKNQTAPPATGPATERPVASAAASNTATAPASPTAAATAPVLDPSIEDALSCRVPPRGAAGDGAANPPLQRFDLTAFPLAACNDGSPAVLFFRPYEGQANRDKWVIALNGGGSCATAQDCADRWCGKDTNFDSNNMSTDFAGKGLAGDGILERAPGNPFGDYNQVEVRYCTSDLWAGRGLDLSLAAKDPATGADVRFDINFAGAYVFQAVLATLRQDGVEALVYRGNQRMPDLDDAVEVVLAGGSAGGAGVIFNLDRFADMLKHGGDRPIVRGFIEAVVGPDRSQFGYANTETCAEKGLCTYEDTFKGVYTVQTDPRGEQRWTDDSCLAWHRVNAPGTEWKCYDESHVLANHITTPFFVRSSLTDRLISTNAIAAGYTIDGQPLTVASYAQATASFLNGLRDTIAAGEEHGAVSKLPGVFAPSCSTHYTLFQTQLVKGVAIQAEGKPYHLLDVWDAWVAGRDPQVVVTSDARTDVCPGER